MTRGYSPYTDIFAHHPPWMFFFTWLIALTGVRTVLIFRLIQCIAFTGIWIVGYISTRNNRINAWAWILCVLLDAAFFPIYRGFMVLADPWAARGLLILSVFLFTNIKWILTPLQQWISALLIVIVCMSAYWTLIPLSVLISAYIINGYLSAFMERKRKSTKIENHSNTVQAFLVHSAKMICIASIPFAILFLGLMWTGNMNHFIKQTYTFNRTKYAKFYKLPGYSRSFINFHRHVKTHLINSKNHENWIQDMSTHHIFRNAYPGISEDQSNLYRVFLVTHILFALILAQRRRFLLAMMYLLYISMLFVREDKSFFHCSPYFYQSFFASGYVISDCLLRLKQQFHRHRLMAILLILMLSGYGFLWIKPLKMSVNLHRYLINEPSVRISSSQIPDLIRVMTDPDERIYAFPVGEILYLLAEREPASGFLYYYPWIAVWNDAPRKLLDDLEKHKPPVMYYVPETTVWSYQASVYAKPIISYINRHYEPFASRIPKFRHVYIRKEMRTTIRNRIEIKAGYELDWRLFSDEPKDHDSVIQLKKIPAPVLYNIEKSE
ncbi:hypothetical protein JW979_01560 [bacterium]|nr:hypothetical protein [candidate division CSSED10-310 bacterium]